MKKCSALWMFNLSLLGDNLNNNGIMESHRRKIDCKTIRLEQKLATNNIVLNTNGL